MPAPADADAPAADGAAEDSAEDAADQAPSKPHRVRRIVLIVVAAIVAVLLILLGLFCWNRWLRYDDAAEIQGEWFAAFSGKRAPIVIDGETIEFNPDTKWHYTLDTTAKTITFTFGSQSGGGRYWFAGDHEHLIIEDGTEYTPLGTFMADLQRTVTGKADEIPTGDAVTVLSRSAGTLPDPSNGVSGDSSPAVEGAAVGPQGAESSGEGALGEAGALPVDGEGQPAGEGAAADGTSSGDGASRDNGAGQTGEAHA